MIRSATADRNCDTVSGTRFSWYLTVHGHAASVLGPEPGERLGAGKVDRERQAPKPTVTVPRNKHQTTLYGIILQK